MRYPLLLFTLACAIFLGGCANKVAVFDTAKAFQVSEAGKAGYAHLEQLSASLQAGLVEASESAKKKSGKNTAMLELQNRYEAAQMEIANEQQRVMNVVTEKMRAALEAYREKHKIDIVMDVEYLPVYNSKVDITDAVVREMDSAPVDFGKMPESEEGE